jgi:hypothetical protein
VPSCEDVKDIIGTSVMTYLVAETSRSRAELRTNPGPLGLQTFQ